MVLTYRRVTLDDRGIRRAPLLWFFGTPFDVAWDDITGWATVEQALLGGAAEQVVSQSLELHTAGKVHFIDGSGPEFAALVAEVGRRLPGKQVESILVSMQRFRGMGR